MGPRGDNGDKGEFGERGRDGPQVSWFLGGLLVLSYYVFTGNSLLESVIFLREQQENQENLVRMENR